MRHRDNPKQHVAAFFFILLTIIVLAAFILETNVILRKIDTESTLSRRFIIDWLSCKTELLAYPSTPTTVTRNSVAAQLSTCDLLLGEIAGGHMAEAMGMIDRSEHSSVELLSSWSSLRLAAMGIANAAGAKATDAGEIAAFMSRSSLLESMVRERIDLLEKYERNQRSALMILHESSIAAILILIGLGLWSSSVAARAQADNRQMQRIIEATFSAQEAERGRIALDLHDSIAQEVSAALMLARRMDENEEGNRSALVSSLKSTIDALRRISWDMRPPELSRLGFQGATTRLIDDFGARCGIRVDLATPRWDISGLREEAALHLYRIVQEILANVEKHASAKVVQISVVQERNILAVVAEDDGAGFDPNALDRSGATPAHLGIAGMRERARLIGGTLEILSKPGGGTRIKVEVPCEARR
jgi:signal transduction histidine kinase